MPSFRAIPAVGHVLGTVARNIGPAIRMSWPWLAIYAIVQVIGLMLFPDLAKMFAGDKEAFSNAAPGTGIMLVTLLVLSTIAFSSLAVNWHRFMLLGEEPEGEDLLRLDALVFRYIGNAMLAGLIIGSLNVVMTILVVIVAMFTPDRLGILFFVILFLAILVASLVVYPRLFLKLPAIALGRDDYGFRDALADSAGNNLRIAFFIVVLTFVIFVFALVLSLPLALVMIAQGEPSTTMAVLGWTFQLVINWLGWIVGINALTTLYGIFAEGREV